MKLVLASVFVLTFPLLSHSSEFVIVLNNNAAVRALPQPHAKIIEYKQIGEKVRVSSRDVSGWKKVRTRDRKKLGWISVYDLEPPVPLPPSDIRIDTRPTEDEDGRERVSPPVYYLKTIPFASFLASKDSSVTGSVANPRSFSPGLILEIDWPLTHEWWHGLRFQPYSHKTAPRSIRYPLMYGIQRLWPSKTWAIGTGLYAGVDLPTSIASTSYIVLESLTAEFIASLRVSHHLDLVLQTGFYTNMNIIQIFKASKFSLVYSGPFVGLGLQFKFYQSTFSK